MSIGGARDGLIISNHIVIAAGPDSGNYLGLDETNGSTIYQYSTKPPSYCPMGNTVVQSSYPAVSGDLLFAEIDQASGTNCGYGLNPPQWSPALGADYLNNQPGYYVPIDAPNGESALYGYGLVAAAEGHVFFSGFRTNHLETFIASSGEQVWDTTTPGVVDTIPTFGDGEILIGYSDVANVSAVSTSGEVLWNVALSSSVLSTPSYSNGVFYFGTNGGTLYAVNGSGSILWSKNISSPIESTPAISDGRVFFGADDGYLYALNSADGSLIWRVALGGEVEASPAISSNQMIYIGSTSGMFYGIDATTGRVAWQMNLWSPITSSTALDNGYAFVADSSGVIHAIVDASAITTTSSTSMTTSPITTSSTSQSTTSASQTNGNSSPGGAFPSLWIELTFFLLALLFVATALFAKATTS